MIDFNDAPPQRCPWCGIAERECAFDNRCKHFMAALGINSRMLDPKQPPTSQAWH